MVPIYNGINAKSRVCTHHTHVRARLFVAFSLGTGWSCHPTARAVYAIGITVQLIAGVTSVLFPFFHLKRFRFIRLVR